MYPCYQTVKLRSMQIKKNQNDNENKSILSTDVQQGYFEILVKGQLDESWSDWLGGLKLKLLGNGDMLLCGQIEDQAALMGILNKLYNLNLNLLSFTEVNTEK
jgi:hypothetical protein